MKAKFDFDPIAPDEIQNLPLDFSSYLAVGDTITSVVGWFCSVASNSPVTDPSPASRLSGLPTLDSKKTKVIQTVSTCVAGVVYVMEAVVNTVNGERLSVWAFIECKQAGVV